MDYAKHYSLLIEKRLNNCPLGYSERHHIIPKCRGGDDSPDNIVKLTPEEHYLAHLLLCKIFPKDKKLLAAALFLTSNLHKRNNKQYGWVKRLFAASMTGDNHPIRTNSKVREANLAYMTSERNPQKRNPRKGEKHHFFGKKKPFEFSESAKRKLSEGKTGVKNPYFGADGWKHPTCTPKSRAAWARADEVFLVHLNNKKLGYSKISKLLNFDCAHRSMGILNKIKAGWNPLEDEEWKKWKQRYETDSYSIG